MPVDDDLAYPITVEHTRRFPPPDVARMASREAVEHAARGESPTAEAWEAMPPEYLGDCQKQCYGPRVMVKGGAHEFGTYGIYVCTGCGYAWPPGLHPSPLRTDRAGVVVGA